MPRTERTCWGRAPGILTGLVCLAAAAGCAGETSDESLPEGEDEDIAAAQSALQTPTCVTVRRGVLGDVHDAFLSGDYPYWATGGDYEMYIGQSSGGNENRILVSFDLDFLPSTAIVTSATFMLFVGWPPVDTTIRAHEVLVPWEEATVKTATFPPGGYALESAGSMQTGSLGFRFMDVTGLVKSWVSGAKSNHGMLLEETPVQWHNAYSSESGMGTRPALAVCYVNGPAPHAAGALVAGGVTSDSEGFHFIGSLSQGPGRNAVSTSENHRFVGGIVGATQP